MTRTEGAGLVLAAVVVLALPAAASPYWESLIFLFFMYMALALSWNILGGYTGYFSFGHIGFFGLGAYVTAILIHHAEIVWHLAVVAGGAAALLGAAVIAVPCLRLRGTAFAIVMLAFSQVMRLLAYLLEDYTGAGLGIALPAKEDLHAIYYAFAGIAAAALAISLWIDRSTFGLHLMAIRDDELSAETVGIDTRAEKFKAFLLSAAIPGLCGGLYVWYLGYVHPEEAFLVADQHEHDRDGAARRRRHRGRTGDRCAGAVRAVGASVGRISGLPSAVLRRADPRPDAVPAGGAGGLVAAPGPDPGFAPVGGAGTCC